VSVVFASKRNGKNRKRSEKVDEAKESEKSVVFILLSVEPKKFVRKAKNVNYISFHSEMEQYEAKYKVSKSKPSEKNAIFISLLGEAKNLMQKEAQETFFSCNQRNTCKTDFFSLRCENSERETGAPYSCIVIMMNIVILLLFHMTTTPQPGGGGGGLVGIVLEVSWIPLSSGLYSTGKGTALRLETSSSAISRLSSLPNIRQKLQLEGKRRSMLSGTL
jgi:hypothetical protein